jgi:predicted metal-dependent hydrolase
LPDDIDTSPAAVTALATRLLDEGLPFQAHEVLEAAWKAAPPEQRDAWQAMAQLAVALTHRLRGNDVGADRLRQRATAGLEVGVLPEVAHPLRDRLLRESASRSSGGRSP